MCETSYFPPFKEIYAIKTEICETVLEICVTYLLIAIEICEIQLLFATEICENLSKKLQKFMRKLLTEICATF